MEVFADRTRLRQVMINLVNNAIKFTEKGKICLWTAQKDGMIIIRVKDTGIGIPPDKLEAIFQEFTQVDTSTTRKAGGTGLGLPISRKLIEMHGGRLWAESTGIHGEGSIFFVELPLEARITEQSNRKGQEINGIATIPGMRAVRRKTTLRAICAGDLQMLPVALAGGALRLRRLQARTPARAARTSRQYVALSGYPAAGSSSTPRPLPGRRNTALAVTALRPGPGAGTVYIKDERYGPTSSFKDRQAAVAVAAMNENNIREAVIASTGNAAVAYAAACARAGIKLWVFMTSLVPQEKLREAALFGAEVIRVSGNYDQTKQIAAQFAQRRHLLLDRGASSIPARESMKTIAYEIVEQLGWRAPDWYIQAVSGGLGPLGVYQGFKEMFDMGLIDKIPKLAVIQAEGCSPMVQAFKAGKDTAEPVIPDTRIIILSTGDPGKSYTYLWNLAQQYRRHDGIRHRCRSLRSHASPWPKAKAWRWSLRPRSPLPVWKRC